MAALNVLVFISIMAPIAATSGVYEMKVSAPDPGNFKWANCNTSVVPIAIKSLNIQPQHIQLGDHLTVNMEMDVVQTVIAPIKATAAVVMNISGEPMDVCTWYPQYCNYDDICQLLKKMKGKDCPIVVTEGGQKKPYDCTCPFDKATYSLVDFKYQIPDPAEFSISGDFDVKIELKDNGDKPLGCFKFHFCLGKCQ